MNAFRGFEPARGNGGSRDGHLRRVLMTADTYGGVWNYALELAGALGRTGLRVDLATFGRLPGDAQRKAAQALPHVTLHPFERKLEWQQDPWDDVEASGRELRALAEDVRPDLVHLNQYAFGALDFGCPKLVVGHSCVLSWWKAVHGEEAPAEWDRYRQVVAAGLQGADLAVAPTAAMAGEMERLYGPLETLAVIPNAADPAKFRPLPEEPLILGAGRLWDEAKNLAALDAVAPRLAWNVALAGESEHPEGGRARSGAARRLGPLAPERMARWFGRASIYALPARYEPFGLSALEAALSGCTLVLGDIPSLRETWEEAALFVDPDSPTQLEEVLAYLIDHPARRGTLACRARARALSLTPHRQAARYLEAYTSLPELARRRRAGATTDGLLDDSLLPGAAAGSGRPEARGPAPGHDRRPPLRAAGPENRPGETRRTGHLGQLRDANRKRFRDGFEGSLDETRDPPPAEGFGEVGAA